MTKYIKMTNNKKFLALLFIELQKQFIGLQPEDGDILMLAGSLGWIRAFHECCKELKCTELLEWYKELPWYDAHDFDDDVAIRMLAVVRGKT